MRKLLPPVYLLLSIILMAALHYICPLMTICKGTYRWLGLIPLGLGIALVLTVHQSFVKHQTTIKPFKTSTSLVTEGLFNYSRNPVYVGLVLILVGVGLLLGSLAPIPVVIAFAVLLDRVFIKAEEEMLEQTFGDDYLQYKQKVRRWI